MANAQVKRFWSDVTVVDRSIYLDGRPVRTPGRVTLVLPNNGLAEAVAEEWRTVDDKVDPRTMPMTGLANVAIERAPDASALAVYAETDLLCYRAETPPELAAREAERWDPLLDWAARRFDVAFVVTSGIVHRPQPAQTVARLAQAVAAKDAFERTALSPLVTIGGSLVVALMLNEHAIEPEAAFEACHLDELWQAELWGEDWMATDARAARRADFLNAARFLDLL